MSGEVLTALTIDQVQPDADGERVVVTFGVAGGFIQIGFSYRMISSLAAALLSGASAITNQVSSEVRDTLTVLQARTLRISKLPNGRVLVIVGLDGGLSLPIDIQGPGAHMREFAERLLAMTVDTSAGPAN